MRNPGEMLHTASVDAATVMTAQAEHAIAQVAATFEQLTAHSREAIGQGLKSGEVITGITRGNADALLKAAQVASGGMQTIAQDVAAFSKENFERTAAAANALTMAKTMPEMMELQSQFSQAQFTSAVRVFFNISGSVSKIMTEIYGPLQK